MDKITVELTDDKVPVVQGHLDDLQDVPYTFNFSETGAGKTHVAAAIAQALGMPAVVVCPKNALPVWNNFKKEYGMDIDIHSCNKLASSGDDILIKRECTKDDCCGSPKPLPWYGYKRSSWNHYHCTPEFADKIEEGILLIIDEAQLLKNDCQRHQASLAICHQIVHGHGERNIWQKSPHMGKSRIVLLSATITDKTTQHINYAIMLGLLGRGVRHNSKLLGLQGLYKCFRDEEGRYEAACEYRKKYKEFVRDALVIKYSHKCYINNPHVHNIYDLHVNLSPLCYYQIDKALTDLYLHLHEDYVNGKKPLISLYTPTLTLVERLKIPKFLQLVDFKLQIDENCQVIVGLHYRESIDLLSEGLALLGHVCAVIDGSTSVNGRDEAIRDFQSSKVRVIIVSIRAGSTGISLHDTHGGRPRIAYISPGYSIMDHIQMAGRAYRKTTKSDVNSYVVYSKNVYEMEIYRVLRGKSKVLRDVVQDDRLLADRYESIVEHGDQCYHDGTAPHLISRD